MAKVQRSCQRCGRDFWVRESWLAWKSSRGKFCSADCAKLHQKQKSERIVVCLECGKEFKTQQWFLNRGEAKFCSQSCAATFNNRAKSKPIPQAELQRLYYQQKLSMQEIAEQLGCSVHKIQYWMDRYEMARRGWDEASYVKQNPSGDPFDIQEFETQNQRSLFDVAVGLYIGEGTKSDQVVSLANSDPEVIRTWLRFLRQICQVEEKKIFAYLNIFDDLDIEATLAFWEQVTGLRRSQFFKPTIRPKKDAKYGKKSPHGTLSVGVSNKKLARQMTEWCRNALGQHDY